MSNLETPIRKSLNSLRIVHENLKKFTDKNGHSELQSTIKTDDKTSDKKMGPKKIKRSVISGFRDAFSTILLRKIKTRHTLKKALVVMPV